MFNALLKNRKSNKGFTLIELIVVIAILAILALLLVPRFAGFTDSAKVSADKAACSTIEKAVTTLFATGEIKLSAAATATLTYADTGKTWTPDNITVVPSTDSVQAKLEKLLGTSIDSQTGVGFIVNITATGVISSVDVDPS